MPQGPEDKARKAIDQLLADGGWTLQDSEQNSVTANRGVAIGEFPLKSGYGFKLYMLCVGGVPAGAIKAKKAGETLTVYEIQTEK
jgi:type I restriction enzyme, R subunit